MARQVKTFWVLFLVLFSSLFWGCNWKEPVLPAWDTTVQIPVYEKFIMGEELPSDSLDIQVDPNDPDSLLFLSIADSLDLLSLDRSDLSVSISDSSGSVQLDTLLIDSLNAVAEVEAEAVFPGISGLVGQTLFFPDTTIGPVGATANSENFEEISFLDGVGVLRITNRLPLTIGTHSNSGSGLSMRIFSDGTSGDVFADFTFAEDIAPGETREVAVGISNKRLTAPVALSVVLPLQAGQFTVTNDLLLTLGLGVELILKDIAADEIIGKIPPQFYSDVAAINYSDNLKLREAIVDNGSIDITFQNNIQISSTLNLEIPALVEISSGNPFQTSLTLQAGNSGNLNLDFNGYRVSNPNTPGALLDSLDLIIDGQTDPADRIIRLTSQDQVDYAVTADSFFFSQFSGVVSGEQLSIDPVTVEDIVDYEDFDGGITLSEAILQLTVFSAIQIENLSGDIRLVGLRRENGVFVDSAAIVLTNQMINGGTAENPGRTDITLMGPEVVDLLNLLPTDLKFSGTVDVSGEAAITLGDSVWADYVFDTPLRAEISGLTPFTSDLDSLTEDNLVDVVQESADDNLLSVVLGFDLVNQTPLGGDVLFALTTDPADRDLFDAPIDTTVGFTKRLTLTPAPTNSSTGFVNQPTTESVTIDLNRREIQFFQEPPLYYALQLAVANSNGEVAIRSFDFVEINGRIALEIRVDDNE